MQNKGTHVPGPSLQVASRKFYALILKGISVSMGGVGCNPISTTRLFLLNMFRKVAMISAVLCFKLLTNGRY